MDPDPASVSSPSSKGEELSRSRHDSGLIGPDPEDPFSLSAPSIALLGLTIAIATVGVPLAAVLTDRSAGRESMVPTALEKDGSKLSTPISFTRVGQPVGGDSGGKPQQVRIFR